MKGERSEQEANSIPTVSNVDQPRQWRHPFFYVVGTFLNVVIFTVIGPVLGGPIFTAVGTAMSPSNLYKIGAISRFFYGLLAYFAMFYATVPVSYYQTATAASATGAIVAVLSIWLPHSRYLYLAAAIVGAIAAMVQLSRSLKVGEDTTILFPGAIAGAVAAIICTRIAKPFRLGVPTGPELADGDLAESP